MRGSVLVQRGHGFEDLSAGITLHGAPLADMRIEQSHVAEATSADPTAVHVSMLVLVPSELGCIRELLQQASLNG